MSAGEFAVEAAGWTGALLILAAYALVSMRRVAPDSIAYQAMNIVGAAGFVINGLAHGAMPSAVLNIIWIGIGVFVLSRRRAIA